MRRKVFTVKGMTILENIVAFVLIISAVFVAGTGFYTAGRFITKGHMYEEAADTAQCMMESGIFDDVIDAFKKNSQAGKNNKFDSPAMQSCMSAMSPRYTLSSDRSFYYSRDNWVVIKPFSSSDGDISKLYTDTKCVAAAENLDNEQLRKLPGMYLYICVPVDPDEIEDCRRQGYSDVEAIGISDYVPLICYIGEWPYSN